MRARRARCGRTRRARRTLPPIATLHHTRRGHGPPLVLVHGVGDRLQSWDPLAAGLAREREVVAIDLPGFGRSDPLPAGTTPTVEALADAVAALAGEIGLERPHVAGNSLGGGIALELARRGVVRSATAVSPIGFWTPREAAWGRASLRTTTASARRFGPALVAAQRTALGRTLLLGQIYARPWRLDPDSLAAGLRNLAESPAMDATLDAITGWLPSGRPAVPTTIAWGLRDRLLIPRQRLRARRAWPEVRHVDLPGCGHVPFSDDPALLTRVLLEGSAAA